LQNENNSSQREQKIMSSPSADLVVIEAGHADRNYWRDLWRYRELLYILARRDIAVRYKQTVLGIAWAVIRPLAMMVLLTFVFGRIANLPSGGLPYSLLVFAGLVPWLFFASALAESSSSLVANGNLLSKIYFPRLLVPMSAVSVALVDLLIGMLLLGLLMAWYGHPLTYRILMLPVFIILALCISLGLGLWFSTLNVKYRDFQFVVPFLIQLGLYASPIGFSTNIVPEQWQFVMSLNPMVAVIDGFRWALLGDNFTLRPESVIISAVVAVAILIGGLGFFRRTERAFADVI
jgi:lipopolysaccharide transport system permease protein